MTVEPREGLVIVTIHKNTANKVKMSLVDEEEERSLMTGKIVAGNHKGKTAIFGKYALLKLMLQGVEYSFLEEEDIIGFTSYTEK